MLNLTPDEKQKGREAFDQVSRRDFMKTAAVAAGVPAVSLGAFYFGYEAVQGDPVRVGVLGTGDEGNVLLGAINPDFIEVKAIADIRPYNQWRAFHGDHYSPAALAVRKGLMNVYGWETEDEARKHVAVYSDYNDLLADYKKLGIEAVIIALPLHLHAPAAVKAMNLGLHVLTEKLMGHSVHRCKEMCQSANNNRVHLATGHQRHYNVLYHEAVDMIKRGVLGDIHYIRAQWHRNNMPGKDSWQMPMPVGFKEEDVYYKKGSAQGKLEIELAKWEAALRSARGREIEEWAIKVEQKKAQLADSIMQDGGVYKGVQIVTPEDAGYQGRSADDFGGYERPAMEELIRWRLWDRTGGGLMVELGSHQLDASGIFITATREDGVKQHPLSVMVAANRPIFENDRQVMDHVSCIFDYAMPDYDPSTTEGRKKKIGVQYSTINGNGYQGYGEVVYGTKGTLVLEREQDSQLFQDQAASKVKSSGGAGPALDTQASGPPQAAAAAGPKAAVSRGYTEEEEHWAWAIRNNPKPRPFDDGDKIQPRCHPKVALADAVIALTTNIAARKGIRIKFEEEWFDPANDATPEQKYANGPKPNLSDDIYNA